MRPARLYSVDETVCRKRGLPLEMTSSSELPSSADSHSPDEEVELDRRFARSSPCSSFLALFFSRFASFLSSPPFSRCLFRLSPYLFLRVVPLLLSQDSSSRPRCSSAVGCSLPSLRSNLSSSGTPLPLTTTRCPRGVASASQLFVFFATRHPQTHYLSTNVSEARYILAMLRSSERCYGRSSVDPL